MILVTFSLGRLNALSRAELEVARLANTGHSNVAIARVRRTSTHTVARQMSRVLAKLGVGSRLGLATVSELSAWSPPRFDAAMGGSTPEDSLLLGTGAEMAQPEVTRIWRQIESGHWTTLAGIDADGVRHALMRFEGARPLDWLGLSSRTREVLALIARGVPQKAAAMKLGVARATVSSALVSARNQLGFASLVQLLRAYCAAR
jgi:DNA-binding NarL/FixJ family response regulator